MQFCTEAGKCRKCNRLYGGEIVANRCRIVNISENIKSIRRLRGLSQGQLARRINCPRTWISKLERGKTSPFLVSLERIAEALNVTIVGLLENDLRPMDPWLNEIAPYIAKLSEAQRNMILDIAKRKSKYECLSDELHVIVPLRGTDQR
jgi:transcriptional regulator with XRE-family HTH domain